MTSRPRILLTNDDGITSPGLHALYDSLKLLGDVTVAAPDAERSAMGHAITTLMPLRAKEYRRGDELLGYATSGTPADCVKLGISGALGNGRPDVVVSGINLGPNCATNVIYSGTVSAATEARILGVPSLAVSLGGFLKPLWSYAAEVGRMVTEEVLERGLPPKVLLNVNIPNLPRDEIKGIRITRQGESIFSEGYERRQDPLRRPYYWLAGSWQLRDEDPETDAKALADGYVSITPITFDLTAHELLAELESWKLGEP